MIRCRTLGPLELTHVETGEPVPLKGQKNRALLLYLALSPKQSRTREHLTGVFWPEKPDAKARQSLREALRILRDVLGNEAINSEGDVVSLTPGTVEADTATLAELEAVGDWRDAAELATGVFLEGFSVRDAPEFEDWMARERTVWRGRSINALTRYAEQLLAAGSLTRATDIAFRARSLDASSAAATQTVMKALALAGERARALSEYEEYCRRLQEVGAVPDEETRILAARIREERAWHLPETVPTGMEKGAEVRRAPLVGRDAELTTLVTAWEETVRHRTAGVAIIEGDVGAGKTRLGDELLARARLNGATTCTVRMVEADIETSGSALLALARDRLLDAPGLAAAPAAALAAFADHIEAWADRFGRLSGERQPLPQAFVAVLRALTEDAPVHLLVDDAQWCDRTSLLGLGATVRDLNDRPVFITFCATPQEGRDELDELRSRFGRDLRGTAVHIDKLDHGALQELARWAVPSYTDEEAARLARRLEADSAGLPLLAVEILHAVALGLDLEQVAGAWPQPMRTLTQTLPSDLPDAIVAAIRVGFRRLSPPAQTVLAAAAVKRDAVSAEVLGRCTDLSKRVLTSALDELEWQRWVIADSRAYSFVARIVREVVARDMVTEGQRQRFTAAPD